MKLDDFDPPVLAEKSSAQYKREIFGDNWERMTPQKLKWLIALSGPANDQYYGKGETRRGPGPGINDNQFPKKAKRKTVKNRTGKNSMVVGPGGEPSKPFENECNGNNACIARKAKDIVDQYFAEKPPGQPLSRPVHTKDTQRKRAKMPKLTLGPDGKPVYQAPRPTGTYAQTGKKRFWGGVSINTDKAASPAISQKNPEAEKKFKALGAEVPQPRKKQKRVLKRRSLTGGSPGEAKPANISPEDRAKEEQARLRASKASVQSGGARSGPRRAKGIGEGRDYVSNSQIDEKITQALYG